MRLLCKLTALLVTLGLGTSAGAVENKPPGFGVEIRLGPFGPRIGNQAERTAYRAHFGNDQPFLKSLEFERYLAREIGLLGAYFRIGHWKISGSSLKCQDAEGVTVECDANTIDTAVPGNDRTTLMIVPLSIGAVYRFDIPKRLWNVPLLVYGKAGLDYYLWRSTGGGKISEALVVNRDGNLERREGRGGTAGFHLAAGLSINLDWIEGGLQSQRSFLDSYLFAEITWRWADGFGDRDRLDMSDSQFLMGLAFDFL